ncbi:MAG TPA: terpene cyclase/mutase family protein [Candidatus Ozemobacteraceae bacterium]|nr:terpene cyclase/mutase family protein [Candidatus Ozemobacteraceae bacterium]
MPNVTELWKSHWGRLLALRRPEGGFPYFENGPASVEPTIHAVLAGLSGTVDPTELVASLDWLATVVKSDGSVTGSPAAPVEGAWLTAPYALVMTKAGRTAQAAAALAFLERFASITVQNTNQSELDGSLVGWPWTDGAFSWVEPTAWGVLAFEAAGKRDAPRAVEGRSLLLDRQIPSGGWNYGSKKSFGKELIPFPDTTAYALMALAGHVPAETLQNSIGFLERDAEAQESPYSLALSLLALDLCESGAISHIRSRLAERFDLMTGERLNAVHLGLALQALGNRRVIRE